MYIRDRNTLEILQTRKGGTVQCICCIANTAGFMNLLADKDTMQVPNGTLGVSKELYNPSRTTDFVALEGLYVVL